MVRQFLFQRNHTHAREWDPLHPEPGLFRDCIYLGKVLAEFAAQVGDKEDLHCYLTWDADSLPEYGPHVVAILVGEECGSIPRYARHVRMVGRIMGRYPFLGVRRWWPVNKLTLALVAKYARNWIFFARTWLRYRRPPASWPAPVRKHPLLVHLPWGSASLLEVPMKSMAERTSNYTFSGQVGAGGLPKRLSRGSLVEAVAAIEHRHPELAGHGAVKVHTVTTEYLTDAETYAAGLMNSKVCFAPRGSVADTWRYFEGLKSGCVVLTNPLPDEWYYRGAPVLQLNDWSELEGVLLPLLADPERLERMHQQTLRFWDDVCGEKAVGRHLAAALAGDTEL